MPTFHFDNTYVRDLPGFYMRATPAPAPVPRLLFLNSALADELGLDATTLAGDAGAALFSGNALPAGADPIAQAYAGHQFGGFSPQLGDGRALLLGELIDRQGQRRDIAFKGSGRTPYSRGGDGRAAVGPMLREVLIGEAMHALGVPSTRALAVAGTGALVQREAVLPGAVLTRVAASHLRVGTFQFFAARGELDKLGQLADYAIARHDPALAGLPGRHLALLQAVATRQASLIAQWMNVGFIHGVMNTDNMAISGETIDYGPCAFLEAYDPATVFSSIDHGGRYAYGNQPHIARWNLARLAEALLPLMADSADDAAVQRAVADAMVVIDGFPARYEQGLRLGQCAKLGLPPGALGPGTTTLADDWLDLLALHRVDFTLAWRRLADAAAGDANPLRALFAEPGAVNPWLDRWALASAQHGAASADSTGAAARAASMRLASPWVIARNHQVEQALTAASDHADMVPFNQLLAALRRPFDDGPDQAPFAEPAPAALTAGYRTFCGT